MSIQFSPITGQLPFDRPDIHSSVIISLYIKISYDWGNMYHTMYISLFNIFVLR